VKWWKKAVIGSFMLLLMVGVIGFLMHQRIVQNSFGVSREAYDEKLETRCGEIVGAGMVLIWVTSYKSRKPL